MKKDILKRWGKKGDYACFSSSSNSWRTLPRSIEPDDVQRLLRKRFATRDKCMMLMLLRCGMRIGELLALKLQHINLKERTVIIHESVKNGKGRVAYISDDAYKALRKSIRARDPKREYLFYSRRGCRFAKIVKCSISGRNMPVLRIFLHLLHRLSTARRSQS